MTDGGNTDGRELLAAAYRDFNGRRIDAVLERMHPDVEWANGMEGGYVHGREGVRAYWIRQFGILDPHVEPLGIDPVRNGSPEGRWIVRVHQVVRDLKGNILLDTHVQHAYRISGGLIERMDIEAAAEQTR